MATTVNTLIEAKYAEAVDTVQYVVPASTGAIIDKFTVTNTSANNESITINLVESGDVPQPYNRIIDQRLLAPLETYTCPELVGHILLSGDFISTVASTISTLSIRASGRQIT